MHKLAPKTALGKAEPISEQIGDLTISENSDLAIASVAARLGKEKQCVQLLQDVIGSGAPSPGHAALSDTFSAIWLGPDQWLVTAPLDSHELLADEVSAQLSDIASVTEQNDAWVCFDIMGASVANLFERLCPVPLRRMSRGEAQRTTIHHIGCIVVATEKLEAVRVLGPRSSAGTLHHALVSVARGLP